MIPLLYLICGAIYLRDIFRDPLSERNLISILLRTQILVHGAVIIYEWLNMTQVYRSDVIYAMAFSSLFLIWASLRPKEPAKLLILIWPVAFVLTLLAAFLPDGTLLSDNNIEHAKSIYAHIFLALIGYASFFLVTLTGFLYLQLRYLLQKALSPPWMKFLPSLLQLGKIQQRALWVGIIAFTVSIGLGKLSPYLWGIEHKWSSKELLSVVIWSIYTVMAVVRHYFHTRKDWFAYSALVGFVLVAVTIFILGFFSGTTAIEVAS